MTDEFTPAEMERMLSEALRQYAADGLGELDDARVYDALRVLLDVHRSAGTAIDQMVKLGAGIYGRPYPQNPTRVEFRIGWSDTWPDERRAGKSVHLGHLPLAELLRGGQG